ncbi:hypothetical protein PO124_35080 [Bacillus licheniformis]|nr:hypothetical protein [Bacillus licheniformis]
MRVILPEALYHGERNEQLTQEELAPRFGRSSRMKSKSWKC